VLKGEITTASDNNRVRRERNALVTDFWSCPYKWRTASLELAVYQRFQTRQGLRLTLDLVGQTGSKQDEHLKWLESCSCFACCSKFAP